MRKKTSFSVLMLLFFISLHAGYSDKAKLPERYKVWIEGEVGYIITPKEKDVFTELETDRERDLFIEAFWKQRDPTPGTPQNEFKEEHYRRLNYANEYFGRGTPRPGWKTDQGRIYIILGPPMNIERYENVMNVNPTQIWSYLGDSKYGLPTGFNIVFFKREGIGEYILYSPSDHGPQSLIANYMGDARNVQAAYQSLSKLEPNLARHTLSLIPGERSVPGYVSLASNSLFTSVFSYPQKKVEDSYAEAILKYKDFVEVEYTANYIRSEAMFKVVKHDADFFLIHYSVEPKKLSVDYIDDNYNAYFELDGRISDLNGRTVYQYTKEIPLSLNREQLQDVQIKSFALQDVIPFIPGHYTFDLLVKNTVSKEFTSFESDVTIPQNLSTLQMSTLILGYGVEKSPSESKDIIPFKIGNDQILCQSRKTFTKKDPLYISFQLYGLDDEIRSHWELRFTFLKEDQKFLSKTAKISDFQSNINFIQEFFLEEFPPGYYSIKVSVLDGEGKEVLYETEDFEITFAANIPRPYIISKVMPYSRIEEYDYNMGIQYHNTGNYEKAKVLLEKAYQKNPRQLDYALGYTQILFINQDYKKIKEVLMPFLNSPDESDGVLYFLGKATHSLGGYPEALTLYEKYLSRFGLNLEILNLTGTCHYQLGDKKEALKVWERSLEINPNQTDIKKLVESLKKEQKE